jgi:ATP-dependent Clp protease adaptor protein ClpS
MSVELETEIDVKEKIKEVVQDPGKYKVIFANDNETPMDFVVELLVDIFRHSAETAQQLTMTIHENGSAVVGVYVFEIAEQKAVECTKVSREHGYPLQVAIEKE